MTLINATIFESGTTTPLAGYCQVTTIAPLQTTTVYYVQVPVVYPLVAGTVTFDLVPSDIAKVAYQFDLYLTGTGGNPDSLITTFQAVVPYSATAIPLASLATQTGIRFDKRDASLLTLARYLTANDSFIGFFGQYLWNNKGTYVGSTVYKRGDVVFYNTSSYQFIGSIQSSGILPGSNAAVWAILVSGSGGGGITLTVGTMMLYTTTAAVPPLYLRCNNAAVSRTTYSGLFAVTGTQYGAGDGTTTFNIPDSPINGSSSFIVYTGV